MPCGRGGTTVTLDLLLKPVQFALGAVFLLATVGGTVVGGTAFYLYEYRTAALDRVLQDGVTLGEVLGLVLQVDVVLVAAGLVVFGLFVTYVAETSESGMGGE